MAWLKVSFSPVSGAAATWAGCDLAGLAFLAGVVGLAGLTDLVFLVAACFAGCEARDFFAGAFFAVFFFMGRHSLFFDRAAQVWSEAAAIVNSCLIRSEVNPYRNLSRHTLLTIH